MTGRIKTWAIRAVRGALLCALILGLTGFAAPAMAADDPTTPWPDDLCTVATVPGYAGNQITLTCTPPPGTWNGALLVYAHGYVGPQQPLALPVGELSQIPGGEGLIGAVLSQGFAFATTSYSKNGYAVEQADGDLDMLVDGFRAQYGPAPAILVGASEGGLITVRQIETDTRYQGGLALCGPVAGMPYQVNYLGDFRVVFDYFFPGLFNFGAVEVPEDAWMHWDDFYAPRISLQIMTHPRKAQELFNVTGAAHTEDPQTYVETTLQGLFYSIFGMNDAIATTGGIPYDNRHTEYVGSSKDWHLNKKVERVKGKGSAIKYTRDYYEPTGAVNAPLVTMHNTLDPAVPYQHKLIYDERASAAIAAGIVEQITIPGYGHCNFTPEQVLYAFGQLMAKMPPMP